MQFSPHDVFFASICEVSRTMFTLGAQEPSPGSALDGYLSRYDPSACELLSRHPFSSLEAVLRPPAHGGLAVQQLAYYKSSRKTSALTVVTVKYSTPCP